MLNDVDRRRAAAQLVAAGRACVPVAPLRELYPLIEVEDAYRVQGYIVDERCKHGATVRGHKVGLTSLAMQQMMGVDEPDFGHLLSDMFVANGGVVATAQLIHPRVEPELAFVLKDRLRGPGVTSGEVLGATEYVAPALEIIDSRIANWDVHLTDTVADNASSGLLVLGDERIGITDCDLENVHVTLRRNGNDEQIGKSSDVLGNPATAVAWLANKLARFSVELGPGDVVLSGSFTRAVDAVRGDRFDADFPQFGSVHVSFS